MSCVFIQKTIHPLVFIISIFSVQGQATSIQLGEKAILLKSNMLPLDKQLNIWLCFSCNSVLVMALH